MKSWQLVFLIYIKNLPFHFSDTAERCHFIGLSCLMQLSCCILLCQASLIHSAKFFPASSILQSQYPLCVKGHQLTKTTVTLCDATFMLCITMPSHGYTLNNFFFSNQQYLVISEVNDNSYNLAIPISKYIVQLIMCVSQQLKPVVVTRW